MESDLDWLRKKEKYLLDWKSNFKGANDALPFVDANLEMTEWELEALGNRHLLLRLQCR